MIYTALTCRAMKLAYDAHHGQIDKGGMSYVFHPFHLAEQMEDEYTTCAALLHDVVEDTQVSISQLEALFPIEVTRAIRLLTHDKGEDYFDYVRRIREDPIARAVKRADLLHNMDKNRLSIEQGQSEKTQLRRKKYADALRILEEISDVK